MIILSVLGIFVLGCVLAHLHDKKTERLHKEAMEKEVVDFIEEQNKLPECVVVIRTKKGKKSSRRFSATAEIKYLFILYTVLNTARQNAEEYAEMIVRSGRYKSKKGTIVPLCDIETIKIEEVK